MRSQTHPHIEMSAPDLEDRNRHVFQFGSWKRWDEVSKETPGSGGMKDR